MDKQTEKWIILDETDDADRVLLAVSAVQKGEKITIYDFTILNISQYREYIVSWGLWWFPALIVAYYLLKHEINEALIQDPHQL